VRRGDPSSVILAVNDVWMKKVRLETLQGLCECGIAAIRSCHFCCFFLGKRAFLAQECSVGGAQGVVG